jgi:hypothetical protein
MKVSIKNFDVAMDVKTSGIEFEIYDNENQHLGDLVLTKTKLVWCKGRIRRENGKQITWNDFIALMDSRP